MPVLLWFKTPIPCSCFSREATGGPATTEGAVFRAASAPAAAPPAPDTPAAKNRCRLRAISPYADSSAPSARSALPWPATTAAQPGRDPQRRLRPHVRPLASNSTAWSRTDCRAPGRQHLLAVSECPSTYQNRPRRSRLHEIAPATAEHAVSIEQDHQFGAVTRTGNLGQMCWNLSRISRLVFEETNGFRASMLGAAGQPRDRIPVRPHPASNLRPPTSNHYLLRILP
jgi:hypothetical protein